MKALKYIATLTLFAGITLASAEDAQKKADGYPLITCVVSGEPLEGDMGGPVSFDYKGREIKFCCPHCKKDFLKDPEKYLKILDDAAKAKAEATGSAPSK